MAASGRRAIDISRIQKKATFYSDDKWFVTLDKDKQNALPVNFSFKFDDVLFEEMAQLQKRLSSAFQKSDAPFNRVNWQKLRRKAEFRLHSLRNRKAIKLILEGLSVQEVQIALGWSDLKSLQRYLKISPDAIRILNSYEKVLSVIEKTPASNKL